MSALFDLEVDLIQRLKQSQYGDITISENIVYIQRLAGTYDRELFNAEDGNCLDNRNEVRKEVKDNSCNMVLNNYSG